MNLIQPYLPWALLGFAYLLAHLRFRRWSIEYSESTIRDLESRAQSEAETNQHHVNTEDSPLDLYKEHIRAHVNTLSEDEKINALINDLAQVMLFRDFESIYYQVYQSQIRFIRYLNSFAGPAPSSIVAAYFEALVTANPSLTKLGFDPWIKFLINRKLIRLSDSEVEVTPLGHEFVVWLARNRSADKPDEQF